MVHRLNQVMPFEYGAHLIMTLLFLFTMNLLEFFLNLPLVGYNAWLYVLVSFVTKRSVSYTNRSVVFFKSRHILTNPSHLTSVLNGKHKLDEIRILQDENLPVLRKRELIKLIFFIVCFFLYLYKYVSFLL